MGYTISKCGNCGQTYYDGTRHKCPPPPMVTVQPSAPVPPAYPQKIKNYNSADTAVGFITLTFYALGFLGVFRNILETPEALTAFAIMTIWLINSLIGAAVGSVKKQTGTGFFAATILPVIGWIIMAVVPKREEYLCPICRSGIERLASKCPRCQSFVS